MPNFPREKNLDALLSTTAQAMDSYSEMIANKINGSSNRQHVDPQLANQLANLLADTESTLKKQLQTNSSVVRVDPKMVRALENAIDRLTHDPSTENKVKAAHFAIFGFYIPFWNELKSLQHLLQTESQLRRGTKAAPIEEMEEEDEEER